MNGHYLMVVLPDGKSAVRREYLPLEHEDETVDEATQRWVDQHPSMVRRVRNRDKTARALRAQIVERRLCRPSSWHRRKCEEDGVPFPRPVRRGGRRRRQ